jgi:hypothetical protein
MRPLFFCVLGMIAGVLHAAAPAPSNFSSGVTRVSLLELFTSEGCSSCPPAERWLGSLRESPGLWRDFVPLAFHVNYWDRLGWPDRFATREFTARQRAHVATWGSDSVYTPCFIRDGAEWRPNGAPPTPLAEEVGVLRVSRVDAQTYRVEFHPTKQGAKDKLDVHLALLGGGLSSKVTAGENRGETLRHEFVVLALESHALPRQATDNGYADELTLPHAQITDGPRRALAVWVTPSGKMTPLQATGGWLEGGGAKD